MSDKEQMTAKEYLQQVMHIDQRINSKIEQVMNLRDTATRATSTLSDMPRSPSPNNQMMSETIAKIVDLEREINADIDKMIYLKHEAREVIGKLADPDQQLILEMRYLCYKSWEKIAEELNYSDSNVFRLHGLALKNLIFPIGVKSIELE